MKTDLVEKRGRQISQGITLQYIGVEKNYALWCDAALLCEIPAPLWQEELIAVQPEVETGGSWQLLAEHEHTERYFPKESEEGKSVWGESRGKRLNTVMEKGSYMYRSIHVGHLYVFVDLKPVYHAACITPGCEDPDFPSQDFYLSLSMRA